jgi:hypothetical protein
LGEAEGIVGRHEKQASTVTEVEEVKMVVKLLLIWSMCTLF